MQNAPFGGLEIQSYVKHSSYSHGGDRLTEEKGKTQKYSCFKISEGEEHTRAGRKVRTVGDFFFKGVH